MPTLPPAVILVIQTQWPVRSLACLFDSDENTEGLR